MGEHGSRPPRRSRGSSASSRFRLAIGVAFLLAQLAAVVYARFTPARYFAWAPYDVINLYTLEVRIGGRVLSTEDVRGRYRLGSLGRDNRSIRHVMDVVRQYETTYGAGEHAEVIMRYTTNGGPERTWRWPPR